MIDTLFRAKDGYDCWLYGALDNLDRNFPKILYKDKFDNTISVIVKENTVGQYTWRKDRFSNKIFVGDIVQILPRKSRKETSYGKIVLYKGSFRIEMHGIHYHLCLFTDEELKVVGNIFDNTDSGILL